MVSVKVAAALDGWPVMVGCRRGRSGRCQEQTLSGTGARAGCLGVVTGLSAASTGGFIVCLKVKIIVKLLSQHC